MNDATEGTGDLSMERKLRYAWWGVLVVLVILAVWKLFLPNNSSAYVEKSVSSREIVIYVAGAVEKPMLISLPPDARLDDALKLVSPLVEADLESMNPAERLKDGQKVTVPYKVVLPPPGSTVDAKGNLITPVEGSMPVVSQVVSDGKININTADADELDELTGVGPAIAERIIQHRTEHGPFARPEDIKNVSGIGTKTFEKMASEVKVNP